MRQSSAARPTWCNFSASHVSWGEPEPGLPEARNPPQQLVQVWFDSRVAGQTCILISLNTWRLRILFNLDKNWKQRVLCSFYAAVLLWDSISSVASGKPFLDTQSCYHVSFRLLPSSLPRSNSSRLLAHLLFLRLLLHSWIALPWCWTNRSCPAITDDLWLLSPRRSAIDVIWDLTYTSSSDTSLR